MDKKKMKPEDDDSRFGFVCKHEHGPKIDKPQELNPTCRVCGLHKTIEAYRAECPHQERWIVQRLKGPHAAKLECKQCESFLRWVSKEEFFLEQAAGPNARYEITTEPDEASKTH